MQKVFKSRYKHKYVTKIPDLPEKQCISPQSATTSRILTNFIFSAFLLKIKKGDLIKKVIKDTNNESNGR